MRSPASMLIGASAVLAATAAAVLISTSQLPGWLAFALKLAVIIALLAIPLLWFGRDGISRRRLRTALATTLLIIASTALSLIAAEMVARHAFHDVTTTGDNTSYFARRWREHEPLRENSWGFREREFSPHPEEHQYRIAVIGDSFTFGQGIPEEHRLTNVLEGLLNDRAGTPRRFEVLNFGRPGAETIDHVRVLEETVSRIDPDFVILQWFVNDLEGHDKSGRPAHWELLPSDYLSSLLHRNSALYYLLSRQWIELQLRLGFSGTYDDYMHARFDDEQGSDYQSAREQLLTFLSAARRSGIPVGIVAWPRLGDRTSAASGLDFLIDRILTLCRETAIRCVDLRPVFADVTPTTRLWANRMDSHPGKLANELAARTVLDCYGALWLDEKMRPADEPTCVHQPR